MGFLPKDLARITCELMGISLTELRTNKTYLGVFAATLKDAGTLCERIAAAVNEQEFRKPMKEPRVTPKEIEELCARWRGTSAAKEFAESLAERADVIQTEEREKAFAVASAAATKAARTKHRKNRSEQG